MNRDPVLAPELIQASRNLEKQFEMLRIKTTRIPANEWTMLPSELRSLIPIWVPLFLSEFTLSGEWLELIDPRVPGGSDLIMFLTPREYTNLYGEGDRFNEIFDYGFFPFAQNEANGSFWITTLDNNPNGEIFYLDHSGWGPDAPSSQNGLYFINKDLASFLSTVSLPFFHSGMTFDQRQLPSTASPASTEKIEALLVSDRLPTSKFESLPIEDIVDILQKHHQQNEPNSGISLVLISSGPNRPQFFSGSFVGMNFSEALESICEETGFYWWITSSAVVIAPKRCYLAEQDAADTPPPLPPVSTTSSLIPAFSSRTPTKKSFLQRVIVAVIVAAAVIAGSTFAYHTYKTFVFPSGYRNRPTTGWGTRMGEKEFDKADAQINSFTGTFAFGNSPQAVELARRFSETLKSERAKLFTSGFKLEILEQTKGEFMTYCELHAKECAFIVHVPQLRKFDRDVFEEINARKLLAQLAWMTARITLKEQNVGKPQMELAVGLRGISQYGPIMLGYYEGAQPSENGLIKYLDDGAETHFLWTFFAPEEQPRPR